MSQEPGFAYCLHCKEPIMENESATTMGPHPIHVDCFIRIIMGGANHILKIDKCYGGTLDADNDGLTPREAARAARIAYQDRERAGRNGNTEKLPDCD